MYDRPSGGINCLTGTPVQNHLEDVGSLLAFLRIIITPFEDDFALASKNFASLLDSVCLRRTQELLHLLDIAEKYHYYIKNKASLKSGQRDSFGIFQVQTQLRLLYNHWAFQSPFTRGLKRSRRDERDDFFYSLGRNAEIICSTCGIHIPAFDVRHALFVELQLRGSHQQSQEQAEHAIGDYFRPTGFYSKMEALMEDIQKISGAGKR
ncbi:SNF2 family N-terminal domain-containing protein [Xylaria scruposa]|nr:SNF2 family N-terminal domain-containing protein [Xylaria scruposa]